MTKRKVYPARKFYIGPAWLRHVRAGDRYATSNPRKLLATARKLGISPPKSMKPPDICRLVSRRM